MGSIIMKFEQDSEKIIEAFARAAGWTEKTTSYVSNEKIERSKEDAEIVVSKLQQDGAINIYVIALQDGTYRITWDEPRETNNPVRIQDAGMDAIKNVFLSALNNAMVVSEAKKAEEAAKEKAQKQYDEIKSTFSVTT